MLGIIVAMPEELQPLMKVINKGKDISVDSIEMFEAKISGLDCLVSVSGVGKVASSSCTRLLIDNGANHILNIGSAGVAEKELDVGDLVISNSSVQTDVDLSSLYKKYKSGQAYGMNKVFYKAEPSLIDTALKTASNLKLKPTVGIIGTQDNFMNSPEETKKIHEKFGIIAKDMESGAIGQVCDKKKIPFLSVKILSDNPKDDKDLQFYHNLEPSLDKGSSYLSGFAKQYLKDHKKTIKTSFKKETKSKEKVVAIFTTTESQRSTVLQKIKRARVISKDGENYVEGYLNNTKCVLAVTGIGKVNASNCARGVLDNYNVDTVILSGTAGAVDKSLNIGDVVIAEKSVQGDYDVTDLNLQEGNNYKKGQLLEASKQFFTITPEISELTKNLTNGSNIRKGVVVTKDQYENKLVNDNLTKDFGATCEDTEAGAIDQICEKANMDCVIIKGISKLAQDLNKKSYPLNEKKAMKMASEVIHKFIISKEKKLIKDKMLNKPKDSNLEYLIRG